MRHLAPLAAIALLLAACADGGEMELRVFAASSLQEVLPRALEGYEPAQPDVRITFQFAGSQALATQIEEGAGAHLFISANPEQVERLAGARLVQRDATLLENRLVLAVAQDSDIGSLEDLAEPGVRVAIGAPGAPVGALAREALARLDPRLAGAILGHVVTEDPSVRVVLSRVETGEVDAAFVYHTDIARASRVRAVEIPSGLGVPTNRYVLALLDGAPSTAREAFDYLLGAEAQAVFEEAGFIPSATSGRAR